MPCSGKARRAARRAQREEWMKTQGMLYAEPIAGLEVKHPATPPLAGDVLLGYQVVLPKAEGCAAGFTTRGWVASGVLLFVFWPLACLPFLCDGCYEAYMRPVYGNPNTTVDGVPVDTVAAPSAQHMAAEGKPNKEGYETAPLLV